MAKIKDLSNKQLIALMEKYQKLLTGLRKERAQRLEKNPDQQELYTKDQWTDRQQERWKSRSRETREVELTEDALFHLSLDESTLEQNEKIEQPEVKKVEEVGVTTLLSLSQSELQKLKKK